MSFSDAARSILDNYGKPASLERSGLDALPLRVMVSDFGFGPAPAPWPAGFGQGLGRHARFRIHPDDVTAQAPVYGDAMLWDGDRFELRIIAPEPACFGAGGPLWIVALGVADQRGTRP